MGEWDGGLGGRGMYVYLQLIYIVVQQKTQHRKAIILQLKKYFNKRENKCKTCCCSFKIKKMELC